VGQQAARLVLGSELDANGATIIFTNASASLKGFPSSGAFAMACHAMSGLAQSMPQGIYVLNIPIDAAIGWTQEDGTRAHRLAGTTVEDNMADPNHIAETYLQLHRQHEAPKRLWRWSRTTAWRRVKSVMEVVGDSWGGMIGGTFTAQQRAFGHVFPRVGWSKFRS
jgi:hypothetical protein